MPGARSIGRDEPVRVALPRLLGAQLAAALATLGTRDGAHAARKALREARGLLRLARGCVRGKQADGIDRDLRDAARLLAPVREADALVGLADTLAEAHRRDAPEGDWASLQRALRAARREVHRGRAARFAEARALVQAAAARPLHVSGGRQGLLVGHRRSLRQAQRAWRAVLERGSDRRLHEWRKRAKDLRHHCGLLAPAFPEVLGGWDDAWHALSDGLGEHRDLGVILDRLSAEHRPTLGVIIAARRRHLAKHALRLGHRLHAPSPAGQIEVVARWLGRGE